MLLNIIGTGTWKCIHVSVLNHWNPTSWFLGYKTFFFFGTNSDLVTWLVGFDAELGFDQSDIWALNLCSENNIYNLLARLQFLITKKLVSESGLGHSAVILINGYISLSCGTNILWFSSWLRFISKQKSFQDIHDHCLTFW